ncbi:MAG: hypothetical protein ACK5DE_06495 [Bacteroidota bacterium]|jgi:hypothetical protein
MSDYDLIDDSLTASQEYINECNQMMKDMYHWGIFNEVADLIVEYGWDHVKARIDDALNRINGHEE